ncbi:uncharacterized protein BP01DRAFT_424609 [Aspergillus saccharolyticus JOP 1030-1]|uniref:ERCC4 domain-containing protein n=1 Tax=Aspergillus saccharolyticus JOP 1030-1 TaxID=1450539 RepID=A0A319A9X9_9EURO|nr:hypothetical protein BP01DRAFT_424609 [Aspergillus saccharolyticus JOP 1030-1]PYH43792.1 hypothetical protein BP01DRAFT_424609 [Aspergillus saccharolyticus JOP 1030-1]
MPEVISLLSSTPPPPVDRHELSSARRAHSTPPAPASFDEVDLSAFTWEDDLDLDNPAKRRRLSHEALQPPPPPPRSRQPSLPKTYKNDLFLFSDEDVILSSEGPGPGLGPGPGPALPKLPAWTGESDPITFTSSAPEPRDTALAAPISLPLPPPRTRDIIALDEDEQDTLREQLPAARSNSRVDRIDHHEHSSAARSTRRENIEDFSSDQIHFPDIDELLERPWQPPTTAGAFSSRTAALLANLQQTQDNTTGTGPRNTTAPRRHKKDKVADDVIEDDEMDGPSTTTARKPRKATARTSAEKDAKAREREAAKAQREEERRREKERKQRAKEEKAREKQLAADIAEVNKLKVGRKESTPEMLIDLASTFEGTSIGNQTTEFMKHLGVELSFFTSSIPSIVKWRRKIKAIYNEALGYWEPCAPHIREEKEHVLCLVPAQELIDMIITPGSASPQTASPPLEQHIQTLKSAYPGRTPIYLIEGLTAWMRKNNNSRNRAYVAEVRRQYDEAAAAAATTTTTQTFSSSRRKKKQQPQNTAETTPPVDDDTIEDALLGLQVTHGCLIHHTSAPADSAEWIKNFTEHISTVPYRRERMNVNDSAFCMDVGQVKPGENRSDTFVKMLQEVHRITASMAYGIAERYPSVLDLVRAMRREGPALLEDVKKSANKNGALTDSRIGPAASRRLYKVFMGMDPSSTDV